MKVRYVGPQLGATGFDDGKVYEVLEVHELSGLLRVIDESGYEGGYLYSPTNPELGAVSGGHFEIVEDDENGSLHKAIFG